MEENPYTAIVVWERDRLFVWHTADLGRLGIFCYVLIYKDALTKFVKVPLAFAVILLLVLSCK